MVFDPKMTLAGQNGHSLLEQLRGVESLKNRKLHNTIIHFTSENCACTQFSEAHKTSINNKAQADGFTVLNIHLPRHAQTVIPSTPSIVIISEIENLLYFGPYSTGLACSETNGYIETVLQSYAKGYDANLIIDDAKGCYCNT